MLMFAMVKEDVVVDGSFKAEVNDRYVYRSNDSLKITCSEIQIMRNLVRRKRKGIHDGLKRRLCVQGGMFLRCGLPSALERSLKCE